VEVGVAWSSFGMASMFAAPAQNGAPQGAGLPLFARVPLKKPATRMEMAKVRCLKSISVEASWSFCGWKPVGIMMILRLVIVEEPEVGARELLFRCRPMETRG
jgi:hypothetical protein